MPPVSHNSLVRVQYVSQMRYLCRGWIYWKTTGKYDTSLDLNRNTTSPTAATIFNFVFSLFCSQWLSVNCTLSPIYFDLIHRAVTLLFSYSFYFVFVVLLVGIVTINYLLTLYINHVVRCSYLSHLHSKQLR